ncbi:hypothetical protein ACUXAV_004891 [Cupriavidus metallidurans]|uniref:hypothetical protein n=1 Tax=Cupriavidus TaxID=106589 RepID=UPI000497239B|nr:MULTISPECIES: hypothetical protein [Cupriavidus]MDE4922721.1 hypothetical protein [Cupriavidus metallidurans]
MDKFVQIIIAGANIAGWVAKEILDFMYKVVFVAFHLRAFVASLDAQSLGFKLALIGIIVSVAPALVRSLMAQQGF